MKAGVFEVFEIFTLVLTFLVFVSPQLIFAAEWNDDFEDEKFSNQWWEPIPQGGQVGIGIWKKGWYSVKSIGDGNVAFSLLKLKVGSDFIKTFDGMVMKGMFVDSGTGPGRHTSFMVFSYNEKEAYTGGGFVGGRQLWTICKIDPSPGAGYKEPASDLIQTPMANSKAGPKSANMIFELKIEIKGNKANVFVDGKEATSYTFKDGIPKGRIGLAAIASHGHWDNFAISGPGLAVAPAGKLPISWGEIKRQK
jgi:hypothetical protein